MLSSIVSFISNSNCLYIYISKSLDTTVTICPYNIKQHAECFIKCIMIDMLVSDTHWTNPQYLVSLSDTDEDDDNHCSFIIQLMQKDRRKIRQKSKKLLYIGFVIYKVCVITRRLHYVKSVMKDQSDDSSYHEQTLYHRKEGRKCFI